jgi:hypothetical protein
VHVRLLGLSYSAGDTVTVEAGTAPATRLQLRCVTYAPDSEPCGTSDGSTLRHAFTDQRQSAVPPEFVVMITGENSRVPQSTIDRG